jgi:hypothetical protein
MQTSRDTNDWPCPKKFTNTSINQILIQHPRASYLKEKLNGHNIYCIEQFLNATNTELLTWNQFHHNIKKIPRGQCPRWFYIIQDLIATSTNPSSTYSQCNSHILANWTPIKKGWIITNNLTFGRIYNPFNKNLKTRHYILLSDNTLIACKGCKLSNTSYHTKHCYFNATKPIYNLQVDCKKRIHINLEDFKKATTLTPPTIPRIHNQTIHPTLACPLCSFINPPMALWNDLVKANFNTKTTTIHITSG